MKPHHKPSLKDDAKPKGEAKAKGEARPTKGSLYIVAGPIGNLQDLSPRAAKILSEVDLIACESTAKARKLLAHIKAKTPLKLYQDSHETAQAETLCNLLLSGRTIALLSDAGTPGLSDPGFRLARSCHKKGIPVIPIPGPSAPTALLSASGLPTNSFLFLGFSSPKSTRRRARLAELKHANHTTILFESPHRIEKLLAELLEILGDKRIICVGRELTKLHESLHTGPAKKVIERLSKEPTKGEYTLLIAPHDFEL